MHIVVAIDDDRGIGKDGSIPWNYPKDLARFKALTCHSAPGKMNAVVMGRVTWESLPERFRPLPGRLNVVVTSRPHLPGSPLVVRSLDEAIDIQRSWHGIDRLFVIGGSSLYEEAAHHPSFKTAHVTRIPGSHGCDRFFPDLSSFDWQRTEVEGGSLKFETWTKSEPDSDRFGHSVIQVADELVMHARSGSFMDSSAIKRARWLQRRVDNWSATVVDRQRRYDDAVLELARAALGEFDEMLDKIDKEC